MCIYSLVYLYIGLHFKNIIRQLQSKVSLTASVWSKKKKKKKLKLSFTTINTTKNDFFIASSPSLLWPYSTFRIISQNTSAFSGLLSCPFHHQHQHHHHHHRHRHHCTLPCMWCISYGTSWTAYIKDQRSSSTLLTLRLQTNKKRSSTVF